MKDNFQSKFKCMHNSLLVLNCLLWLPKNKVLKGETYSDICVWKRL